MTGANSVGPESCTHFKLSLLVSIAKSKTRTTKPHKTKHNASNVARTAVSTAPRWMVVGALHMSARTAGTPAKRGALQIGTLGYMEHNS